MKKMKRILALLGAVILAGLYLIVLILGLTASPAARNMLMAAIACTVIIPCLLYGMILITRVLDNRKLSDKDKTTESNTPSAKDKKKNDKG